MKIPLPPERQTVIPDMGASLISEMLEDSAAKSRGSVVEVGSWLGAGTVALARGAAKSNNELWVYDRWRASADEVEKAEKQGVKIKEGQDLLPLVEGEVNKTGARVNYVKGDLLAASYNGNEIGLYVDDAAKRQHLFTHVLKTFAPRWQDGATLILMDYYYYREAGPQFRFQHETVSRFPNHFVPIEVPNSDKSSHAAFIYTHVNGEFIDWVEAISLRRPIRTVLRDPLRWALSRFKR